MKDETMTRASAERALKIGLLGGVLTLIGDLLIGAVRFPEGVNMLEGYLAGALAMPVWRPILGGLIGFLGICLEFPGLMTIYPLLRPQMKRGAAFYRLAMYVYLAVAGGAVHLPCGAMLWLYHAAAGPAGTDAARTLAMQYMMYFLIPAGVVFLFFFYGASIVQFAAFVRGKTPFPRWYAVFNLLIGQFVFNSVRLLGSSAVVTGIATSNKSLGALAMFAALLLGWKKYVGERL